MAHKKYMHVGLGEVAELHLKKQLQIHQYFTLEIHSFQNMTGSKSSTGKDAKAGT